MAIETTRTIGMTGDKQREVDPTKYEVSGQM